MEGGRRRSLKKWDVEEDLMLARLVQTHGVKQWAVISNALPGRTGKQVSETTLAMQQF